MRIWNDFAASLLFFPSLTILGAGMYFSIKAIRDIGAAFLVASIKVVLFFVYFHWYAINGYYLLDDLSYFNNSFEYWQQGNSFLTVILNKEKFAYIFAIAGGQNMIYYLYNILSFDIFGGYYFSPVCLNIILTFFSAYFLYKFLLDAGLSSNLSKLFFVFFVLNPEIIVWSNFLNLKDTLVHTLTILSFYNINKLLLKPQKRLGIILSIITVLLILSFLRFYIPLFILGTFFSLRMLGSLKRIRDSHLRYLLLIIVAVIVPVGLVILLEVKFSYEVSLFLGNFTNPISGIFRYLMTPVPWKIVPDYSFLLIPSILHWLLLPFMVYGIYFLIKLKNESFNLILLYLLIMSFFYGCFGELQGPRHRLQLNFVITICQFLGLFLAFINKEERKFMLQGMK